MTEPTEFHNGSDLTGSFVGLAPPDAPDPLIEVFKKDVDRTMLIENLRKTVDQRARQMQRFLRSLDKIRGAAGRPGEPSSRS